MARFVGDSYRYSVPIVLDVTPGTDQVGCNGCHIGLMGQQKGEVIGVFSSSVSAKADFGALRRQLALMGGFALVSVAGLLVLIRWIFKGVITRRLRQITATMLRLAKGDTDQEIQGQDCGDEIGDMARAVEVFRNNAIEARRLAAEQVATRAAEERRQAAIERDTHDFGESVSGVMTALGGSAESMRRAAATMSEASTTVHARAVATASAAEHSSSDSPRWRRPSTDCRRRLVKSRGRWRWHRRSRATRSHTPRPATAPCAAWPRRLSGLAMWCN